MSDTSTQISKYYKSFSGTDTLAFIMMPGCSPVVIGSLTTISYSMFRNKKPVINIGRTNINGVTRGSRIFAGTMIFTLINQHWLKELQEQISYIKDFQNLKVDELPLFDIMIISANEYGNAVSMYIYGIDFTDEAQTISVEDLFTENTFSFVARDISNFHAIKQRNNRVSSSHGTHQSNVFAQKLYVLNSSNISLDDLAELEREFTLAKISETKKEKKFTLSRELYYSSSRVIMGNDVAEIQELLKRIYPEIVVNGIFDETMDKFVRRYQSDTGQDINGIVDDRFYTSIKNEINTDGTRFGVVVNRSGAMVYRQMSMNSNVTDTLPFRTQVELQSIDSNNADGYFQRWYKISTGFVLEEDIYSSYYTGNILEFPIINPGDINPYVSMIQEALNAILPNFTVTSGEMDELTIKAIKLIQEQNGLYPSGIVDMSTWKVLQSLAGNINTDLSDDSFKLITNLAPGVYNISKSNTLESIQRFFSDASCNNHINVKTSAIAIYKNGKTTTKTKSYVVKEETRMSLEDFRNSFVYNPSIGDVPYMVEYIVYPYGKRCYKWTIVNE